MSASADLILCALLVSCWVGLGEVSPCELSPDWLFVLLGLLMLSVCLFDLSSSQPCLPSQCASSVYFGFSMIWDFPEFAHIQPAATWLGSSILLMLFSRQDKCPLLFFLLEVYSFFRVKLSSYTPPLLLVLSIVTSNG